MLSVCVLNVGGSHLINILIRKGKIVRDGKNSFYKHLNVKSDIRILIRFFRDIKHKMMKGEKNEPSKRRKLI